MLNWYTNKIKPEWNVNDASDEQNGNEARVISGMGMRQIYAERDWDIVLPRYVP